MKKKLLFCMQMWSGDADAAYSLLELLADIALPEKYTRADLLISFKQEAPTRMDAIARIGRAFDRVHTFRCQKGPEGWPGGPNHQAEQTWRYFMSRIQMRVWDYSGIFLAEADGIPCGRDWLDRVTDEWDACGRSGMGCFVPGGPKGSANHVNGNMIMGPRLSELRSDFARAPRDLAWDWHHRKFLMENCHPATSIFSDYKVPDIDIEALIRPRKYQGDHPLSGKECAPAWLHGTKNWQVVHPALRKFLQLSLK